MKLRHLPIALAMTGLVTACDQIPLNSQDPVVSAAPTAVQDDSPVAATVNGVAITDNVINLYQEQRRARRPNDPNSGNREAVLDELINLELARQDAEKTGVAQKAEIQLQIEQQRRTVIAAAAIQDQIASNPITDAELQKIYDDNVSTGSEFKARHILVKEEAEARKLITELDGGADFSELAKEHSTGPSGKNGGELGWFSAEQMVAPFSEAVAAMEKGNYTKDPVETQFGWHVIILDDSRQSTPPAMEQLKPQLQMMAQNQRVQDYIARLRSSATVEIKQAAPTPETSAAPATEEPAAEEPSAEEPAKAE